MNKLVGNGAVSPLRQGSSVHPERWVIPGMREVNGHRLLVLPTVEGTSPGLRRNMVAWI